MNIKLPYFPRNNISRHAASTVLDHILNWYLLFSVQEQKNLMENCMQHLNFLAKCSPRKTQGYASVNAYPHLHNLSATQNTFCLDLSKLLYVNFFFRVSNKSHYLKFFDCSQTSCYCLQTEIKQEDLRPLYNVHTCIQIYTLLQADNSEWRPPPIQCKSIHVCSLFLQTEYSINSFIPMTVF